MMANAPQYMDTNVLLMDCIKEQKVAYVAGTSFFCDGGGKNTLRLNFSYETLEKNEEGVKRLGDFFKSKLTK
jgi:2-aminoadipate transaminase